MGNKCLLHLGFSFKGNRDYRKTARCKLKDFQRKLLEQLNALKSNHSTSRIGQTGVLLYQQAFCTDSFGDSVEPFTFQLSQHMNNLETLLNAENTSRDGFQIALSVIKSLQMTLKKLSERPLQIQQCKGIRGSIIGYKLRDDTSSGIVSEEEDFIRGIGSTLWFPGKISGKSTCRIKFYATPFETVQNNDENNVFAMKDNIMRKI
ncbi:hypothetical protein Tco_0532106 [Tanacetum coccineum]